MNYIDYREKLGLTFNDKEKQQFFFRRIKIYMQTHKRAYFSEENEIDFCYDIGADCIIYNPPLISLDDPCKKEGFERVWLYLDDRKDNFIDFLSTLVTFVNSYEIQEIKTELCNLIEKALTDSRIPYSTYTDSDGIYYFPKGAKELDDALISEVLEWLNEYPETKTEWVQALSDYSSATEENASDVADKFRKALERFLQEFFEQNKSIENLRSEYGTFMKDKGVPKELSNNLETLLQAYANFMNGYAKHQNKTSKNTLEYIMYQTGNIIRFLITLNK